MTSVSLSKNQTVSLTKQSGATLTKLDFGLGWDQAKKKTGLFGGLFGGGGSDDIDLDASVVTFDARGTRLDTVWFRQKTSKCGSIKHSGDNLTGEGDGDDESIYVDLTKLPSNVEYLCFTVNSFRGQTFNEVENAFCRVLDQSGKELAKFLLTDQGNHTGILIASLRRKGGDWAFTAHGLACRGGTIDAMIDQITAAVIQ
ncbi:tellurium resistance TerZ family protein [Aeromonas encheleia]|uniref:TerD family protein n=1 Tax=Aeromonas encheleia TaxID=73010 RepID=UPI001F58609E|nr:TerD family protein [Aeromonas encheleia]UNP89271.1 tellurium resistance TerZ family protein [Aeromonas encheleia]